MNIKRLFLLLCVACPLVGFAQPNFSNYAHDLSYFLPKNLTIGGSEVVLSGSYNSTIPTPKQVLGYELGDRYWE